MLPSHPTSRAESARRAERRIAFTTRLLDDLVAIPGTRFRVGLDPIVGLLPVVGDMASGLIGLWIVAQAWRVGLPRLVVARMVANVLVDVAVGSVPIVGDMLDFATKANSRNLDLFRRHMPR